MKDKDRHRNRHRLEETKDKWQLKARRDSGLDPETEKGPWCKNRWNPNTVFTLVSVNVPVSISSLIFVLWLRKMTTLKESRWMVREFLYYFGNFSVNLKLFQNRKFFLKLSSSESWQDQWYQWNKSKMLFFKRTKKRDPRNLKYANKV